VRRTCFAVLTLLLLTATPAAGQEVVPPIEVMPADPLPLDMQPMVVATVHRVIDGSSLDADVNGIRTSIGYLGIDTPPLNAACGREARDLNEYLAGRTVLLQEDPHYTFDEIGRRLYYVYALDGTSIESVLLREGLAVAARVDAWRGEELVLLEDETAALGRGCLWSIVTG
jgi:endonuclease YncB( thermonuclease family)